MNRNYKKPESLNSSMKSSMLLSKNTTDDQKEKLSDKYKFVAALQVATAYALETHFVQEKDYIDGNFLYVPHEIIEEDREKYNGCRYIFFLFVTEDKYVRKRIEKLLKKKLDWNVYEYTDADKLPALDESVEQNTTDLPGSSIHKPNSGEDFRKPSAIFDTHGDFDKLLGN